MYHVRPTRSIRSHWDDCHASPLTFAPWESLRAVLPCLRRGARENGVDRMAREGFANGKWLVAGMVSALLFVVVLQSAWGVFFPREHVVAIQLNGLACGTHFELSPRHLDVEPGSWVRVVNDTPWTHTLKISDEDSSSASARAESPKLEPSESWRFRVWETGTYYIMSDNQWHYLSGLQGQIWVSRQDRL